MTSHFCPTAVCLLVIAENYRQKSVNCLLPVRFREDRLGSLQEVSATTGTEIDGWCTRVVLWLAEHLPTQWTGNEGFTFPCLWQLYQCFSGALGSLCCLRTFTTVFFVDVGLLPCNDGTPKAEVEGWWATADATAMSGLVSMEADGSGQVTSWASSPTNSRIFCASTTAILMASQAPAIQQDRYCWVTYWCHTASEKSVPLMRVLPCSILGLEHQQKIWIVEHFLCQGMAWNTSEVSLPVVCRHIDSAIFCTNNLGTAKSHNGTGGKNTGNISQSWYRGAMVPLLE